MEGLIGHIHLFLYFLVLTSVLRNKKEWQGFFAVMLLVSFIVTIYGFFQYFGKVAIHQGGGRLDATFGNATYLAIFLIFHMFLIGLFIYWLRNIWARLGLGLLFILEFVIMFLTATRGAILGFFIGLFVFGLIISFLNKKKILRLSALALLAFIFVVVGIFLLIKNTPFVRNNPVLARLAEISPTETTSISRLTIWHMSWRGFQEHPLLGWGPENYNLVFNKYYEPKLWRQEPWFDRAHNIVFDWLISSGSFGFLSYLGVFIAALCMVWSVFKRGRSGLFESAGLTSLFVAYGFHNIFVFDNLTSYFAFFSILGYIHFSWLSKRKEASESQPNSPLPKKEIGLSAYLIITVVFLAVAFSLYFLNFKPLSASQKLLKILYNNPPVDQKPDAILNKFDEIFALKTFGTGETREQLTGYANAVWESQDISQADKEKVLNKAISEMEKQVEFTKHEDLRYLIFLAALYTKVGRLEEAVKIIDEGLKISSQRQQTLFVKADIYLTANQKEKALEVVKTAYDLDPSFKNGGKNLAIIYLLNGKKKRPKTF